MKKDITGQQFGRIIAIEPTAERHLGHIVWLCKCTCPLQTIVKATASSLAAGDKTSCGCLVGKHAHKDITGQQFGRLTALEPTTERSYRAVIWLCQCSCPLQAIVKVPITTLLAGKKTSCGCLRYIPPYRDLTEQTFGKLRVLSEAGTVKGKRMWLCQCSCGNTTTVRGESLTSGSVKSCGCLASGGPGKTIDMVGMTYGRLTVIEALGEKTSRSVMWLCQCSCEKQTIVKVNGKRLRNGGTKSCGCLKHESMGRISSKISPETQALLAKYVAAKPNRDLQVIAPDLMNGEERVRITKDNYMILLTFDDCKSVVQKLSGLLHNMEAT